jgi:hypothetical protein
LRRLRCPGRLGPPYEGVNFSSLVASIAEAKDGVMDCED